MTGRNRKTKKQKGLKYLLVSFTFIVLIVITVVILLSTRFSASAVCAHGDIDISDEIDGKHVPLFLQSDERWGNECYGDGEISVTGCGPTCLSMVYCYLTGDSSMNPAEMAAWAERKGFYVDGVGTSWSLMDLGAQKLGLDPYSMPLTENNLLEALSSKHVIICSVAPGDFTTEGHFIVLAGMNKDGTIKVNDPNSKKRSGKEWDAERIIPQIKQYWIY